LGVVHCGLGRRLYVGDLVGLAILGRVTGRRAQIEIGRHGKGAVDANLALVGRGILSRSQQILHLGFGATGDGKRRGQAESKANGLFHLVAIPFNFAFSRCPMARIEA
jgi:hypothetical protein